jgi:hypothetical protein
MVLRSRHHPKTSSNDASFQPQAEALSKLTNAKQQFLRSLQICPGSYRHAVEPIRKARFVMM